MDSILEPYADQNRDCSDGPRNIGSSLQLTDDFYAYTFLTKLKRRYVFKKDDDSGSDTEDNDDERQKREAEAQTR